MRAVCILVQSVYDFDPRVRRKAEALVAAGYSVDVLALRPPGGPPTYTLNGVHVTTIGLGKNRGSLARYAFEYAVFFAWAFIRVPLLMRSRRYAVVDVNTLPDFLVFAPCLARWMGARIVLDMHEITPEFYMSKFGLGERSLPVRVLKYLERISFNFADYVVTINHPIQDLLVGRGLCPAKTTVITNAADEARFVPSSSQCRATVLPPPDRFIMMYHGTLTRTYGLDIAVEAFAIAHEAMPGAEMWILGSGPEQGPLADLARRRGLSAKVRLIGQVAANDIPAWLSKCTLGILPFRRDVFLDFASPNKLPEFIIMGKAAIVARLRAIRYYFSEDAIAYFEPDNPTDLAAQMVRLYRDRSLCTRLARSAREEYAPIRWETMKRRYLALIDGIAAPRPSTADAAAAETLVAPRQ